MKTLLAVLLLITAGILRAQVPQMLNYQGRVAVGGVNFDGTGNFKFALTGPDGTPTYWSNDGTSVAGSEPATGVRLGVIKGLYSGLLGDTSLGHMTAVPPPVFAQRDVSLRVWFNDGIRGYQLLTPDQRIAAVGYAMMAQDVPLGAITTSRLADGSVMPAKLAPGAAAANLHASGETGVTTGGLVLSAAVNPALAGAGYVRIGTTQLADGWHSGSNAGAPDARRNHTAVWTGTEMIVWGGFNGDYNLPNGRYNPALNQWLPVETSGSPIGQELHSAIWTGTQMIVWGGTNGVEHTNFGSRYDPASNSWSEVTSTGAPAGRYSHTAVWTGSEMIIWGGFNGNALAHGARYIPQSDIWIPLSSAGAPSPRTGHSAVWTGTEMIIWGGWAPDGGILGVYYGDGARYSPATNTWTPIPASAAAPTPRSHHTAVWTGSEMIIWGGADAVTYLGNGKRYDPATDTWNLVTNSGSARASHKAVWTGSEMMIWGGSSFSGPLNSGARYQPATDTWAGLTTTGAPSARTGHTAVWSGNELIVFGGSGNIIYGDTALCTPGRTMQLYQKP